MKRPDETTPTPAASASTRRLSTLAWGAIPVVVLASLTVMDRIPGTDVSLTVPYAAEGQGPMYDTLSTIDGAEIIEVDGTETDETSGELYMTTVSVRTDMTLAQALGRWLASDDTIVPIEQVIPANQTPEEAAEENAAAFTASEASATVAAMNHLGIGTEIVVADTIDDSPADGEFEVDDVITAVDGELVNQPSQVQELVQTMTPGDEVTLTLRRDDDTVDVTVVLAESDEDPEAPMIGVLMASQPDDGIEVFYNLQDVGGPSAGMIFSLAVIDKMSPGELTGGHRVAGTGTIAEDGTVGAIGGIVHKIGAARDAGIELFLAPADNCAEAMSRDNGDMVIASVATLDDAIAAMEDFAAGEEVETCG